MLLRVRLYGEPILREKGELITEFDDKIKALAAEMVETMHEPDNNSVGLAAQQVGHALQITVMDVYDIPDERGYECSIELDGKEVPYKVVFPLVITNPVVTPIGDEIVVNQEACMSLPGIYPHVPRHEKIHVKYQDLDGNPHEIVTNGYIARVMQHEIDHLFGILTIDRADTRALNAMRSKLKMLKRHTRDLLKDLAKKVKSKDD